MVARSLERVLASRGVKHLFTLCGGHISPILVGAEANDIQVVDVRDEVSAVFAADAVARMTGIPGIAAVTAGPGVTNTITAVKNAQLAQSPIVIFGGAAATVAQGSWLAPGHRPDFAASSHHQVGGVDQKGQQHPADRRKGARPGAGRRPGPSVHRGAHRPPLRRGHGARDVHEGSWRRKGPRVQGTGALTCAGTSTGSSTSRT